MAQLKRIDEAMGCPVDPIPCGDGHICKNCEKANTTA